MQFIVGSGRIAWTVNISDNALAKLQESDNRTQAVKNAMTIWQKIANCFSSDSHKEAFGHVFDLLHAYEKYRDMHASEQERMGYKRNALDALACLRNLAHAKDHEKFDPQYNKDNGQFYYDFCSDEFIADIPLNPDRVPDIHNSPLDLTDRLSFETFENDWIKSRWAAMSDCFESRDKIKAMKLCNTIYESTNVNDRISTFARLSELARPGSRDLFQIKIEDAFAHSAKVSCTIKEVTLIQDLCLTGENYTECLLDCPETLICNERPAGPAAQWIYALGKLSQEKFDSIFSASNKAAALRISDDMCRMNENINDNNIGKLSKLSSRCGVESLFATVRTEQEQRLIDAISGPLCILLKKIHAGIGNELSYNISTKNTLFNKLKNVFESTGKYSPEFRNAIRAKLEESINNEQNRNAKKVMSTSVSEYFDT